MDLVSPSEHLRYVRCTYCNTVLAVGVPCKRLMDTVTVKCGHCNHLSFLSPRPLHAPSSTPCSDAQHTMMGLQQGPCSECRKLSPSSSTSGESSLMIPKAPFVVKPPEKKHRLPSAYNRFMKEEIQRIKAAKPDIPHREAFSMAAKNWAKCDPRGSIGSSIDRDGALRAPQQHSNERANVFSMGSFSAFKQLEHKN